MTSGQGASPVVNRAARNPSPPPIRTLPAVTTAIAADHQAEPSALLTPNTINRPTNTHTEPNTTENSRPARASAPLPPPKLTADAPARHRPHAPVPVAAVVVDASARAAHVESETAMPQRNPYPRTRTFQGSGGWATFVEGENRTAGHVVAARQNEYAKFSNNGPKVSRNMWSPKNSRSDCRHADVC